MMKFTSYRKLAATMMVALTFTACSSGPDYRRPEAPSPTAWKEGAGWRIATPGDLHQRGEWWTAFGDAELDRLEQQVAVSNQNLRVAEAAWHESLAVLAGARGGHFPTVGADAGAQRTGKGAMPANEAVRRSGGSQTTDRFAIEATVSWTPDLWGRIRRTVEAAEAGAQASAADLAGARLSLQAALATLYIQVRTYDEQRRLLAETATADERSLTIARNQFAAGVVSRADVFQAEAQLANVRAQLTAVGLQRAQAEHAIAVLIGLPPAEFSLAVASGLPVLPEVPIELPSALLERRPDIAAAERRMAAANARIGIAEAAYYPDLTLSGAIGYVGAAAGSLVSAPNLLWSAGASAVGTIFDGGVRRAQSDQARAAWDGSVATYRQTVLTCFQQVEDQLAAQRILAEQATYQVQAQQASDEAERVSLNQYEAGTIDFTAVIVVRRSAITNRIASVQVASDRLVSAVNLMAALGGGWR